MPTLYEDEKSLFAPQTDLPGAPPARSRNLPLGGSVHLRNQRNQRKTVLPMPLPSRQTISRPQNAVLRRRTFLILCTHQTDTRGKHLSISNNDYQDFSEGLE